MAKLNKRIRKELRALSEKAYQVQLDEELSKLAERFNDWQNKQIDGFELNHIIHAFPMGRQGTCGNATIYIETIFYQLLEL